MKRASLFAVLVVALSLALSLAQAGCGGPTDSADAGPVAASDTGGGGEGDTGTTATGDTGTAATGDTGATAGVDAGTTHQPLEATAGTGSVRFYDVSADCNAVVLPIDSGTSNGTSNTVVGIKSAVLSVNSTVGKISVQIYGVITEGKTYTCDGQKVDGSALVTNMELIASKYHYWAGTGCSVKVTKIVGNKLSLETYGVPVIRSSGYDALGTYTIDVVTNQVSVTGL